MSDSPGVVSIPDVCGGDPCIAGTRIPVWVLASLWIDGADDAEILYSYPALNSADLESAAAYWDTHRDEIDQQIEAHRNA